MTTSIKVLAWFDRHQSIGDVLITGGDPLIYEGLTTASNTGKTCEQEARNWKLEIGNWKLEIRPIRPISPTRKSLSLFQRGNFLC